MQNIIEQVYHFNQQAGLLDKGYSDTLESAFQIEEALEGLTDLQTLSTTFGTSDTSPKQLSRIITSLAHHENRSISDVDRLDKACDAIVFAIGSMAKLGLTPSQIEQALNIVTSANQQKLGMPEDYYGKLGKPTVFIGPEAQLQQLLDER